MPEEELEILWPLSLFNHGKDATLRARGIMSQISLALFENRRCFHLLWTRWACGENVAALGPYGFKSTAI